MSVPLFNHEEQFQLLELARASVNNGLDRGEAITVELSAFSTHLQEQGATFITLEKRKQLRGCIGSVKAYRSLVKDVADNAWNAAFRDPRFSPVTRKEFSKLHFEISILTQPQPMKFDSEEDLKHQLVPGKTGLILKDGYRRSLFLPAVWEKLPEIDIFITHLKQKAGFPEDYWSETLQMEQFTSFELSDDDWV